MRGLRDAFEGKRIARVCVNRADLRWPFPKGLRSALEGRKVLSFRRRAKYILMRVEGGQSVLLHLGMSGRMLIGPADRARKHEHFVIEAADGHGKRVRAGFVDPRRFGMVDLVATAAEESHRLLRDLGPEPLSEEFDAAFLRAALQGRRSPIKTALLDQKLVCGLGNIYVCEALFRAGIHPERPALTLKGREAGRLVRAIRRVLEDAIASGGSSLRDYVQADGTKGGFQDLHLVYGREGLACVSCGAAIARISQGGRSTFFCAACQK